MFRNTPFANLPTYKIILGFGLCTLGSAMLYSYFKFYDNDDENNDKQTSKKVSATSSSNDGKSAVKQVCLKIVISNDQLPLIIGRSGTNLELIEERTNTKIGFRDKDNDNKFCDISGTAEDVQKARLMLLKEIERAPIVKEEMQVALSVTNKLTACGQEILKEICHKSLAKILVEPNVRNNTKAKLIITGNQKQVNLTRKLLEDKIEEIEELQRAVGEIEHKREPRRSPTNSLNSSMYSSQNSLNSHQLTPHEEMLGSRNNDKCMEVYMSAVASPSKFWLQIIGPQSKKLDEMVEEMTNYYNVAENRAKHELKNPYIGQIVAGVLKYDNKWYRAEIVDIIPNDYNQNDVVIDLYFVDYGDSEYVSPADICELRTDFLTLRHQAVECFLANVKSIITDEPHAWPKFATEKFEELTEVANWKKLIARVVTYGQRPKQKEGTALNSSERANGEIPGVELFDATQGHSINIGHAMIVRGFALPLMEHLPHSRSYTPINDSDITVEEINTTPKTPLSPMSTSVNSETNNTNAENLLIEEHIDNKNINLYLNDDNNDEAETNIGG